VEGLDQVIKIAAIKPSAKAINFSRFADAARLGMRDAAEAAQKDFEKTTATWRTRPDWQIQEQRDGFLVGTENDVWNMLDKGTRAHRIIARRAKRLRFSSGFSAKTRPGFVGSQAGGSSGGPVFAQSVQHPGTTARGWSKLIAAKYKVQLQRYISQRIKEAM
jgi:hypothetical protein